MFTKTTQPIFSNFGTISNYDESDTYQANAFSLEINNKYFKDLYISKEPITLQVSKGMVLLYIKPNFSKEGMHQFIIQANITIKADMSFNFICLSNKATIEFKKNYFIEDYKYPLNYIISNPGIKSSFKVNHIYAFFNNVKNEGYYFEGERHQYWELTYVDNGVLETIIDNQVFILKQFDFIFYKPGQFHTQRVLNRGQCSYITIIFDMTGNYDEILSNQVFRFSNESYSSILEFAKIENSDHALSTIYNDLLIINLNKLIADVILKYQELKNRNSKVFTHAQNVNISIENANDLFIEITNYINGEIYGDIKIEDICKKFGISRTTIQTLFKMSVKTTPVRYIKNAKLNISKTLLKNKRYSVSAVANILGFCSVQYFSQCFKERFKINPKEYAKSIYN